MKPFPVLLIALSAVLCVRAPAEPSIRLQCTPSLLPLATDLVRPLRDQGIQVRLVEEAGNTQVIGALGAGEIDVALLSRALKTEERVAYPDMRFSETTLGAHVVTVVVARTVWDSGVHALKRQQILDLYENKARSWKDVGGEERPMIFFDPAHDHGVWEIFAAWLYGDIHRAPAVTWQIVTDGPDTQTTLEFASGGISVASLRWADRRHVFPLGLIDDNGKTVDPSKANILDGSYPLSRPIVIVFPREPAADKKKLLEFLVGEKGQKIIGAHDFTPQSTLTAP
ncbi:MAG: substrate-binding domain-containing protein [Chthoniobacter sp.]|uniref:substrate-binding domain-containing protein n=1 Tax=Chthoniobacter sp. TaxID=2510640 RepID=UPI0032ABA17B